MGTTYYPWNVGVLVAWLKLELAYCGSSRDIAAALQVPPQSLNSWLRQALPTITLQEIYGISQYRGWSVYQTLRWLELKPAHIEELIAQDPLGDRMDWNDAKALWFGNPAV